MNASIAGYIPAQPFCPIDKPNEPAKFAIPSGTPKRSGLSIDIKW